MVASYRYFLDSDSLRFIQDGDVHHLKELQAIISDPQSEIYVSETVLEESRKGLDSPDCPFSEEQKQTIRQKIGLFEEVRNTAKTEKISRLIYEDLKNRGAMIGNVGELPNDIKIAASAIENGGILVSSNLRDMGKIRGLDLETFDPDKKRKLEKIKEEHDHAESKIEGLEKTRERGEITKQEFQKAEKAIVKKMDQGISRAVRYRSLQQE